MILEGRPRPFGAAGFPLTPQFGTRPQKTEDREYRPLEQIRDNWPKFVITRSDPIQYRNGIVHENVTELIGEGWMFGVKQRDASPRADG